MTTFILFISAILFNGNDDLKSMIDNYLEVNLTGFSGFKYEIVKYPENSSIVNVTNDNKLNRKGNLIYIPVEAKVRGREVKSFVIVKVNLYQKVFQTKKMIEKDEKLNGSDFMLKEIDVTEIKGNPVIDSEYLSEYRAKKIIENGSILIEEWIEKIPIVEPGDLLYGSLITGTVAINIEVTSRDKGNEGDIIKVVSANKKVFDAEIIDSKNVLIIN